MGTPRLARNSASSSTLLAGTLMAQGMGVSRPHLKGFHFAVGDVGVFFGRHGWRPPPVVFPAGPDIAPPGRPRRKSWAQLRPRYSGPSRYSSHFSMMYVPTGVPMSMTIFFKSLIVFDGLVGGQLFHAAG